MTRSIMPKLDASARYNGWISLAAIVAIACGDPASSPDASVDGGSSIDGSASTDGGRDAGMSSPRLSHYQACTSSSQCPDGDVCAYYWPTEAGPVPEPPPPLYCRPPCDTGADCTNDAYGDLERNGYCEDGRCLLYCAVGGLVPTCEAPYECRYFRPSDPRDGYCVLP
jgi:hypothetical protein